MGKALRYLVFCGALLAVAGLAEAQTRQGDMQVRHAWMHAPFQPGGASAAFFRLINTGREIDRLVAVSSPDAHRAAIHIHASEGGYYRMRRLRGVEVHPGAPVMFRPGGLHIMLIDIKVASAETEFVRLRLRFERAGEMQLEVPIVPKTRWGPPVAKPAPKRPSVPYVGERRR